MIFKICHSSIPIRRYSRHQNERKSWTPILTFYCEINLSARLRRKQSLSAKLRRKRETTREKEKFSTSFPSHKFSVNIERRRNFLGVVLATSKTWVCLFRVDSKIRRFKIVPEHAGIIVTQITQLKSSSTSCDTISHLDCDIMYDIYKWIIL